MLNSFSEHSAICLKFPAFQSFQNIKSSARDKEILIFQKIYLNNPEK